MARPGTPAYGNAPADPTAEAFADLDEGALSYGGAEEFTSLSRSELELAVKAGEIEMFTYKRRVLLVKRSVRQWLARHLAKQRVERERQSLMHGGK